MDMALWTKVLLEVYPKLERYIKRYDKHIDAVIRKSFGKAGNAESVLYEIYDIVRMKVRIIYLKELMEEAIDEVGISSLYNAALRYFKGMSFREIAEAERVNIRSVFRRIDRETEELKECLLDRGIDEYECENLWGSDPLISAIARKAAKDKASYGKSAKIELAE